MLTGPRQSGKTTLLMHLFRDTAQYVSLEMPANRAAALEDPDRFLDNHPPPVIFDEVQNAPALFIYIKERIDQHRDRTGQYLLTGSQNLLLSERVSESLAGRVAVLRLLPLTRNEIIGSPQRPFAWETERTHSPSEKIPELWAGMIRGRYPELIAKPHQDATTWHGSYIETYLERDIRTLRQVGDLNAFQSFLQMLAARSGQLLNLTDISRDLGIAVNTAKNWLSVLEATYQVIVLRPYFENTGKRLVKTPKVYFTDTGTLCYLVGLKDPDHAASGPMAGAIFEGAVLTEIIKTYFSRGERPRVYFWRTSAGMEVDFVVDIGNQQLVPIEAKMNATPRPAMANAIQIFQKDYGSRAVEGYVVHPGDIRVPLGPKVTALPFADL